MKFEDFWLCIQSPNAARQGLWKEYGSVFRVPTLLSQLRSASGTLEGIAFIF